MQIEAVVKGKEDMVSTLTASHVCLESSILPEEPKCELVELYRWNDHGVDHIVYMGLDGNRYRLSRNSGQQSSSAHWEICTRSRLLS